MSSNSKSEANPFLFGLFVALGIVAIVAVVFALFALWAIVLQAGWNQGLAYAVQSAGGSIGTISWTTAFNLILGVWAVSTIFFWPLTGAITQLKKAKTK